MNQLTESSNWNIYDSSKIDEFLQCRRKFLYRHILGWELDKPNHDAYFGECVHLAREHQLINGYDDVKEAYNVFINHYRLQFSESTDEIYRPKNPEGVMHALTSFAINRSKDLVENKLLVNLETNEPFTEISGTVPIDDNNILHFRMDSVLMNIESGKIFSLDHKTTTAKGINYPMWENQFYLSIQNGTYTHCLYCLYPIEQVLGVEFDGIGFEYLSRGSSARPSGYYTTHKRVKAYKTPEQMNVWLWTVITTVNDIKREFDKLSNCYDTDTVLECFPINPGGCTKYKGCAYYDFCLSWANPIRFSQEPPLGFKKSFWNPADKDSRNKISLEWK